MKVVFDEIDHFHPNFDESVPLPYVIDVVARMTSTKGDPKTVVHWTSDHVVGPAVQVAFKANMCLWVFYSVFPFFAYFTYQFDWWECQPNTFASCRMCVLALYLPVVLFAMYCEYVAMIYALPPQVAMIGPLEPKVFRRFTAWFLFASSTSLVAHVDFATNSLFFLRLGGRVLEDCHQVLGQPCTDVSEHRHYALVLPLRPVLVRTRPQRANRDRT